MVILQSHTPAAVTAVAALLTFCVSEALRPSDGCSSKAITKNAVGASDLVCPYSCRSPSCQDGSPNNGGVALTNGVCEKICSMEYSGVRYCGTGAAYEDGSHVSCTACTEEDSIMKKQIKVADFEHVERTYWVQKPPRPSQPAPLLVAIHGQGQDGASFGATHKFSEFGSDHNLMIAFPQGMNDTYPGEEQGTGWNAGSAGDNNTCLLTGVGTLGGCYQSCRALNKCGRCNWSTCYDDVLFIKMLIKSVGEEFCIDLDRVYAHGESNGAMLVQHLVRHLPDTFAGVDTWFGTPLLGYLLGSFLPDQRTAYLALHGRNDTTIPPQGGVTDGGWIYEPLDQATGIWAAMHHCSKRAKPLATRWDGGPLNFQCVEYRRCSTGRRVVQCLYDGVHGDWPSGFNGDQITSWFLLQFTRSSLPEIDNAISFV